MRLTTKSRIVIIAAVIIMALASACSKNDKQTAGNAACLMQGRTDCLGK